MDIKGMYFKSLQFVDPYFIFTANRLDSHSNRDRT